MPDAFKITGVTLTVAACDKCGTLSLVPDRATMPYTSGEFVRLCRILECWGTARVVGLLSLGVPNA
jgi:hypothetical protein